MEVAAITILIIMGFMGFFIMIEELINNLYGDMVYG